MKRIACLMAFVLLLVELNAQSLKQFTFRSRLSNTNEHYTGNKRMTFTIYRVNDVLWTETHEQVAVKDGYYQVVLGSKQSFPGTLFFVENWPASRIEKEGLSTFNLDTKVKSMLEMRSYQDWGYGSLEQLRTRIAALEKAKVQIYQDVAMDQNIIIKTDDVTEGIYTLANTTRNNDVVSAIPLNITLAKYGKLIDLDKIALKTSYRDYARFMFEFIRKEDVDEDDESMWYYIWEQQLAEMAGVTPKDEDEDLVIAKINAYLNKSTFNYLYGSPGITSSNNGASMLSIGLQKMDWSFLNDVLKHFPRPLNQVVTYVNSIARTAGPATFLDLLYEDILLYSGRVIGTDSFDKLMDYYEKFTARGARHYKYASVAPLMRDYIKVYRNFLVEKSENDKKEMIIRPYLYAKMVAETKKSGFIASDTPMHQLDMLKVKNPVWVLQPTFNIKYFAGFENNDYAIITEASSTNKNKDIHKVIDRNGKIVFAGVEDQRIWMCNGVPIICVMNEKGGGVNDIFNGAYFYDVKAGKKLADLPNNASFLEGPPHLRLAFNKTIARFSREQKDYCYSVDANIWVKVNPSFREKLDKAFASGNYYSFYVLKDEGGLVKVLDKSVGYLMGRDGSFKIIREDWIDQFRIPFEDWKAATDKALQIKAEQ